MADDGESLESWLNKATNPSNRQEDWEYIMGFCDQINKELEGPQISVRLLAHKIQSPQEWEAMQALTVLEACTKNCGQRFHNELGKFRFLNELIKVVSPKYLGDKVSDKVKSKIIELLYSWTVSLPDEAKISEAYQMLKSQGIVLADPEMPPVVTLIASPTHRPKNPIFDDEKKSKRLSVLLKSKKPEDLQEANRLIKNMVKEDEVRTQKATKQQSTLEAVNSSVKLLNEMLAHFSPEASSEGDKEIMKELYSDCDKLRQKIYQLATETEDNDSNLGDILQASDDLTLVLNSYKKIVKEQTINGENEETQQTQTAGKQGTNQSESLIDLVGLDVQSPSPPNMQPPASSASFPVDLLCGSAAADPQSQSSRAPSAALSLLDEELLSLGLNDPVGIQSHANHSKHLSCFQDPGILLSTASPLSPTKSSTTTSTLNFPGHVFLTPPESLSTTSIIFPQPHSSVLTTAAHAIPPQSLNMAFPAPSAARVIPQQVATSLRAPDSSSASINYGMDDLGLLDLGSPKRTPGVMDFGSLLEKSEDLHISPPLSSSVSTTTSTSFLVGDIQGSSPPPLANSQADDSLLLGSVSPLLSLTQASPSQGQEVSLANVFVPLEAIKPSKVCPVTAYDKNGVRMLLHFASDCPPGRPDVLVIVVSMLNTAPQPVKSIVLQAAVPKTMKVRLQPPTGTELAPFNPILPPAAITQVMLLANPLKEKVRIRYKLTFTLGEQSLTEVGEVNEFPPPDRWGTL